jgi:uncharacterized protein (DUF885 family)
MLAAVFSACGFFAGGSTQFEAFCDELFVAFMRGDALSINILLEHPEEYGLESESVYVSKPADNSKDYKESYEQLAAIAVQILTFNFKSLTPSQQVTYNVLLEFLTGLSEMGDYYWFQNGFLGSYMGDNADLPIYLDKYEFKTKNDVANYIVMINDTADAFADYVAYERARCQNGYGRADFVYEGIIDQAEAMAPDTDGKHYLEADFERKVAESGLVYSAAELESLKQENRSAIYENLLPAYAELAVSIGQLLIDFPTDTRNQAGLSHLTNGKEFYATSFKRATSSSDSVPTALSNMKKALKDVWYDYSVAYNALLTGHDAAWITAGINSVYALNSYSDENMMSILESLEQSSKQDFPARPEGSPSVTLNRVNPALKEYYSPAAYFKSAVDSTTAPEHIYVNTPDDLNKGYIVYELLSHEGFPGHLLQHSYFKLSDAHNVRKILGMSGYSEGWAEYAQMYTAKYFGETELLPFYNLILKNRQLNGYLQVIVDILVNYYGYSVVELEQYLADNALPTLTNAQAAFKSVIEYPTNAATYYYSYRKFIELRADYKGSDMQFHTAVLAAGPMSFELLRKTIM